MLVAIVNVYCVIIGASLSEPHINGKSMCNPYYLFIYIVVRRSYQLRITDTIRSPADMRNNTPCAMTYAAEKRAWTLPLV